MNLPVPYKEPDNEPNKQKTSIQDIGRATFTYFFQGLLLLLPIALTIYLIFALLAFLDQLIPIKTPGVGLLIILAFITIIGYLSNHFLVKPFFVFLENLLTRLPFVKIIYTSLKDLFSAFVSEKRKFDKPVLVIFNKDSGLKKMGFMTQEDMSDFDIKNEVAVYLPHSYNFSGNLFIVPKENVIPLDHVSSTDAMKFIVSGGVTSIHNEEEQQLEKRNA